LVQDGAPPTEKVRKLHGLYQATAVVKSKEKALKATERALRGEQGRFASKCRPNGSVVSGGT